MQQTRMLIDGMNYEVVDRQIPQFDPHGQPTGLLIDVKDLVIVGVEGLVHTEVILRMTPEQLEQFALGIVRKKVKPATAQDLLHLTRGNGRGY